MRKIYFEIEVPEGQIIDIEILESKLSKEVEKILPNARVKETNEDMANYEDVVKEEIKDRKRAKKRSDEDVREFAEEVDRRVAKFSDDDLPDSSRYLPKDFREVAKRNIVTEKLTMERGA